MKDWRDYFDKLTSYEIQINNQWADILKEQGLTLRDPSMRERIFDELRKLYEKNLSKLPDFITVMPEKDTRTLTRQIRYGLDWIL